MAKTASQIQKERKAVSDYRNAVHEKQMAGVAEKAAARTLAVLNKAISGTSDSAKKSELSRAAQMVTAEYKKASSQKKSEPNKAVVMQKKKEDRAEKQDSAHYAKVKESRIEKQLDDYVKTDAHKKAIERNDDDQKKRDRIAQSMLFGGMDIFTPDVIQDEAEQRLISELNRAKSEVNTAVTETNQQDKESMSAEDQETIEQYAVNQIRDQNLPVEMVGVMPTAQQEAAGLIGKIGKQRADELAETFMRQQNAELARQVDAQSREFADKHGVIGSALTVPVAALGGVVGTVGQLQGWARNTGQYSTLDPNATGTIGDTFTGAVRGQVAQNIQGDNPTLLSKGLSIGYQGMMSAADSIARAYLGGGAFGGATLAATGSFSQTMADAARQGATPAQAALLATATSGIEALTEAMPLDDLIRTAKGGNPTGFIVNVLRQMGIEAATEEVSLLGSLIAEAAIMREKSGFNQTVNSLILLGKTEVEARQIAAEEIFNEALNTALVSAVSGIGSGVSAATANEMNLFAETGAPAAVGQPKQKDVVKSKADLFKKYGRDPLTGEKMAQETVDGFAADMNENAPEVTAEVTTEAPQEVPAEVAPAAPVMDEGQQIMEAVAAELPQQVPQQNTQPVTPEMQQIEAALAETMGVQPAQQPVIEPAAPQEETAYQDEFEDWGKDPNREGVENPLSDRSYSEVGKRSVKAYMYENPAVKPFYQEQAAWLLSELADSTKGERTYNEQMHYESGGEQGWSGTKRHTSESIAELLDQDGMSYDQIERGLNAIINDHGQENNAVSKRIEFVINDRLMNGYTDFYTGEKVPGNAEYLNLLRNQQSAPNVDTSEAVQMDASNIQQQSTEDVQGIKGTGAAERNFSGKAEYQNLLSEDNVQRDREGDVRPMEVPKTDSFGRRVSELVGNAYGAEITTDKMANTIEELVQEGALGFDVRHNQDSMNTAAEQIAQRGVAATRKQITNAVASGKIRDGDVEQAILLYAMYNSKDTPTAIDNASEILVDLATMANITGRNLQMFRLLRKMTPEGQVTTIRKTVQSNIDSMIKSGAVKKGYTTEIDPELLAEYRKAAGENMRAVSEEQKKASAEKMKTIMDAIYAMEAAKMPATMKAKWDAWRYMAMLGNAKTQVRNIAGNLAFKPYKEVKDKMGALAEKVFVSKDQRTKSLFTDQSLVKWARQDAKTRDIHDALKYSAKLGDDVSTQKIRDNMQVFNNKALDSVRKFVESVPSAGDMLFKNNYYVRSLAGFLKARGYKATDIQSGKVSDTILAEARAYAIQEAMKATFNDSNAFSDFMATGLRYKGDNPFGKALNIAAEGVLPFRRTPANIAVRFSEYSPVGIAKGLWSAATKVRNGEMTAATAIDQLTSGLTGSAVMALGFALAGGMNGIKITGSGADEDEKRQGHQDYALEFSVDGQEYSYKIDWAAPANLPLFVGANIYSVLENAGENTDVSKFTSFIRGMGTAFEPMLALSCMSGLNNLLESARYAEEGEVLYSIVAEAATGYFTQGIPALVRQAYQATQENKQTTFTKSDDPTIRDLQQTSASIPFAGAEYQTDKRNAWGEKESQGDWMTRAFNSFVNPGTLKKIDNSAAELEISRLNKAGYNVTPNTAARTVSYIDKDGTGHDDVRLTEEQFQKLAETQGQTARKLVEDMISSASYAALTDEQKADAIDTAYLYARKTGEIAAIEDHTGYDQSWFYDVEKGGAEEIIRRVLNSGLNTSMSDLDTAWDRGYNEETFNRELQTAYESYSNAPADMRKQVYAEAEGTAKKYIEARDKGVSHEDFVAAAENIAKVKGTGSINKDTGKATVRDIDRRQAIANTSGMTPHEIDIVMKAYMADYDPSDESPETTEMKYDYIRHEMGMSAKEYAATYRAYLDSSKKAQRIAAIRALGYDYGTALKLYKVYSGSMKKKLIDMYG